MSEKVLITGASGFIGGYVVEEALKRGFVPILFDRWWKQKADIGAEMFLGDIRDGKAVMEAVKKADYVINLAGILGTQETVDNPIPPVYTNIIGALNVFNACRPTKSHQVRAVQIGVGNFWMNNPYSITKYTAVRFAQMYNKEHGTKIAMLRVFNAYGPRQKWEPVRKIIPTFVRSALANENLEIYGTGEQVMDMVYVGDVAEALVDMVVMDHNFYDGPMDFGSGRRITVNWIAEKIIEECNSKSKIVYLPMRPGEVLDAVVVADMSTMKLKKYDLVPFEEGIKKTIAYYRSL